MDASDLSGSLKSIVNDRFMLVSTLTFFVCEAAFSFMPIERARWKQITSIVVGGILGAVIVDGTPLFGRILQGVLAGGATTMVVNKFKKPSAAAVLDILSGESTSSAIPAVVTPVVLPTATAVVAQVTTPEPVEHL